MRRAGLGLMVLAFGLAGAFAANVVAGTVALPGVSRGSRPGASTPAPTSTTSRNTAPKQKPRPKPKPKPQRIAARVTVAGIRVGRMKPAAAEQKVRSALARPLVLRAGNLRLSVRPAQLGFHPHLLSAIARAKKARPGAHVKLLVVVETGAVSRFVGEVAVRFHRDAVDSQLSLRGLRPFLTESSAGRDLVRAVSAQRIVFSLLHNERRPVALPVRRERQAVSRSSFGPVIVIRRGSNELLLYDGMKPWRTFAAATGQSRYPTPLGRFSIVVKWRNPWWYPPNSAWARGLKPVPPGPGNPLGTRWMGLTAPGVGIHGTPDDASIGYSLSHGCIRMHIPDAEWLFDQVSIGTPVFIVG